MLFHPQRTEVQAVRRLDEEESPGRPRNGIHGYQPNHRQKIQKNPRNRLT
jgi:hypothetical protein